MKVTHETITIFEKPNEILRISSGYGIDTISEIASIANKKHVDRVIITSDGETCPDENLEELPLIFPNLEKLSLTGFDTFYNCQFITHFKFLKELYIDFFKPHACTFDFTKITSLSKLSINWEDQYIPLIAENKQLEELIIRNYTHKDFLELPNLEHLKLLDISQGNLVSLDGITQFKNLERLHLNVLKKLKDISSLSECSQIQNLQLSYLATLDNVESVGYLRNLKRLEMDKLSKVIDISSFENLADLEEVFFNNMKLISIKPLKNLKKLKWILLSEKTKVLDDDLSILIGKKPIGV